LLKWVTPPTEMMFFAQASGREFWLPWLLWLLSRVRSLSNRPLSTACEIDV
jgi:hypothetical protein